MKEQKYDSQYEVISWITATSEGLGHCLRRILRFQQEYFLANVEITLRTGIKREETEMNGVCSECSKGDILMLPLNRTLQDRMGSENPEKLEEH